MSRFSGVETVWYQSSSQIQHCFNNEPPPPQSGVESEPIAVSADR